MAKYDFERALMLAQIMEYATKFPELNGAAAEARKEILRMQDASTKLQPVTKEPVKIVPAGGEIKRKV